MSMSVFDFGSLSASLQRYADLDGKIPTVGDRWQDFRWTLPVQKIFADPVSGSIIWENFLNGAQQAVAQAEQKLEVLEDSVEWYMGKPHPF